jgi:copper homeostasis protein
MSRVLIEAAVDSIAAAERAVREGAARLEVCAELAVGGLTPSIELLRACLALGVPCIAMARPQAGGHRYDAAELMALHSTVAALLDAGAHGVAFGVLEAAGTVDADTVRAIVELAGEKQTVFHRAFDRTPSVATALETLIDCGVTRVLTSGQAPTAVEGIKMLSVLRERAGGGIEILPAGSVRGHNVATIVERTGVDQVHARGTESGVIAEIATALRDPL